MSFLHPKWGLNSQPWDEESHALLTVPARTPYVVRFGTRAAEASTVHFKYVTLSMHSESWKMK